MAGIRIAGLGKDFDAGSARLAAVSELSLDIADNQFVTLLGPSGCGKTTTLRLIAGYLRPDAGTIEVGGRLLSSPAGVVPPPARGMGMVFQSYAVWPHKTVFENVVFGLRVRKLPQQQARERVGRILDLVNLAGLEERFPSALSGGQQQRVAIARSLVNNPGLILADEPTGALDSKTSEDVMHLFKTLNEERNITIMLVTHEPDVAAHARRIVTFRDGLLLSDKPNDAVAA